ncbi:MAG: DUF362 domain-containing protein [Clostridiales bacterium]|nr:DUF362 domain-containing protein [Clostridiales bacterium]
MAKSKVAIANTKLDIGSPGSYSREQLDVVKGMIRDVADGSMGGMKNIVKPNDKVVIKINTVVPSPPDNGFTTDPRMLEALVELVKEQSPSRIQICERCAQGADTMTAMIGCGIRDVAQRTGVELVPFETVPFEMYKIDRDISFNEFPVPKPVVDADVYIGLPKMKVHIHTLLTCALKLQFGNLPDYDWMARCHRDDIYQKIVNLTRAAKPTWFLVDSLYACQGNGPFSPYPEDLVKDFNTIFAGSDPVAVDTVAEALMDWENPGKNAPATVLAAFEGLGTNNLEEIELLGAPIEQVKRKFRKKDTILQGIFPNVNVVVGSACEPGCRVLVRMALDELLVTGKLSQLKRPVTIFTGLQFEPYLSKVEGDVIVYGDCAKKMLEFYPDAAYWGATEEFPNCTPVWSNRPGYRLVDHIAALV